MTTRIIEADVPRPLWDQWLDIMVVRPGLSQHEMADAVRGLLDERCGGDDGLGTATPIG